jgi:hypothetical protein
MDSSDEVKGCQRTPEIGHQLLTDWTENNEIDNSEWS